MIQLNIIPNTSYPIPCLTVTDLSKIERLLENVTGTTSKITEPIDLKFSDDILSLKKRASVNSVVKEIGKVFDKLDDLGDYPPDYGHIRRRFEEVRGHFAERRFGRNERIDFREDDFFRSALPYGYGEGQPLWEKWADWAKDAGYPDLQKKFKELGGKINALWTNISVTYDKTTRTITIYRRVVGNTDESNPNFMSALACGIFFAFFYDACTLTANDVLLYSFSEYIKFIYLESAFPNKSWITRNMVYDWKSCSYKYWPYAGALYFYGIQFPEKAAPEHYLFRQIFKECLSNPKKALTAFRAAAKMYEGYSI